jgi:serine/threonine-protein kinase
VLLGRRAAVKVLLREMSHSEEAVSRFFNEARAAAQMHHWGLVEVFDVGLDDTGCAYLVMELLDGETLAELVEGKGKLSLGKALCIGRQIAVAMASAHASGVVHRDLKPENVVLVPDSDPPSGLRVKVLDFGIAKLAAGTLLAGPANMTRAGQIMGTPAFMSPEQCHGASEVDERADVYSLGCILYFMLTGRPPFVSDGVGATIAAQLYEEPPSPASLVPELPDSIDALIMHMLEKQPEARPQTMLECARLLKAAGEGGVVEERIGGGTERIVVTPAREGTITRANGSLRAIGSPRRRRWSAAALPVAVAVLAFLSYRAVEVEDDLPAARAAAPVSAAPPVVLPPPPVVATVEARPEKPRKIRVKVTSRPQGAEVRHGKSGERLGVTPFEMERIAEQGTLALRLSKSGYRSESLELPADRDAQAQVALEKRRGGGRRAVTRPPVKTSIKDAR